MATSENVSYTIPELLGFIVESLESDIPKDWESILLEAKVFKEDGRQGVSVITFFTRIESSESVRFVPTNSIGIMNAVLKIHKIMCLDAPKWVNAKFTIDRDGMVDIQTDI
jgi:hypothetical protein